MTVEPIVPPTDLIGARLEALAECLCAQIAADGGPSPCFCGVVPGDAVVGDYGGDCEVACGMAWVRLITVAPVSGVGIPNESVGNCSSEMGLEVEVGILRCMEIPEDGSPLPEGELLGTARLQWQDAQTIRRAILCCPAMSSKDVILRGYQPMGPLGGLVGGAWSLSTAV